MKVKLSALKGGAFGTHPGKQPHGESIPFRHGTLFMPPGQGPTIIEEQYNALLTLYNIFPVSRVLYCWNMDMEGHQETGTQALRRVISILDSLSQDRIDLSLTDFEKTLSLPKGTVHRLCSLFQSLTLTRVVFEKANSRPMS
jgi:hypothetical protein